MIILDEKSYIKKIIEKEKPLRTQKEINLYAVLLFEKLLKVNTIVRNIEEYLEKTDEYVQAKHFYKVTRAITYAKKHGFRIVGEIFINEWEMEVIESFNYLSEKENEECRRILFMMLYLAKAFKHYTTRLKEENPFPIKDYLYLYASIEDILWLAEVRISFKKWKKYKHEMTKHGLITPTIYSKKTWIINYFYPDSQAILKVLNNNPITYYQEYKGAKIIECENCKKRLAKITSRKYCSDCAYQMKLNAKKEIKVHLIQNIKYEFQNMEGESESYANKSMG
jgi:hypothetical protein